MKSIIEQLEESRAQIADQQSAIETLNTRVAEIGELNAKLTADLEAAQKLNEELEDKGLPRIAELQAQVDAEMAARQEIERLHAELADELEKAKAAVEDFDTATQRKAQEILGDAGSPPVAVTTAGERTLSADELVAQLEQLKKTDPKAATAFINKHKSQLLEASRKA